MPAALAAAENGMPLLQLCMFIIVYQYHSYCESMGD
jgi:hypothetical protein